MHVTLHYCSLNTTFLAHGYIVSSRIPEPWVFVRGPSLTWPVQENELHKSAEFKITSRAGTAVESQVLPRLWRLLTISCWPLRLLLRYVACWRAPHGLFWNAPLRRPKISHHSWIKQGTWYGKYSSNYYVLLQENELHKSAEFKITSRAGTTSSA